MYTYFVAFSMITCNFTIIMAIVIIIIIVLVVVVMTITWIDRDVYFTLWNIS